MKAYGVAYRARLVVAMETVAAVGHRNGRREYKAIT